MSTINEGEKILRAFVGRARAELFGGSSVGEVKGIGLVTSQRHGFQVASNTGLIWIDIPTAIELKMVPDDAESMKSEVLQNWLNENLKNETFRIRHNDNHIQRKLKNPETGFDHYFSYYKQRSRINQDRLDAEKKLFGGKNYNPVISRLTTPIIINNQGILKEYNSPNNSTTQGKIKVANMAGGFAAAYLLAINDVVKEGDVAETIDANSGIFNELSELRPIFQMTEASDAKAKYSDKVRDIGTQNMGSKTISAGAGSTRQLSYQEIMQSLKFKFNQLLGIQ